MSFSIRKAAGLEHEVEEVQVEKFPIDPEMAKELLDVCRTHTLSLSLSLSLSLTHTHTHTRCNPTPRTHTTGSTFMFDLMCWKIDLCEVLWKTIADLLYVWWRSNRTYNRGNVLPGCVSMCPYFSWSLSFSVFLSVSFHISCQVFHFLSQISYGGTLQGVNKMWEIDTVNAEQKDYWSEVHTHAHTTQRICHFFL
jgi:hypothetical protein